MKKLLLLTLISAPIFAMETKQNIVKRNDNMVMNKRFAAPNRILTTTAVASRSDCFPTNPLGKIVGDIVISIAIDQGKKYYDKHYSRNNVTAEQKQ